MQTLTYEGPGQIAWQEVPDAALLEPSDAIVRPLAVATCDLDWQILAGRIPFPAPFPLGHEFVGEILELGSDTGALKLGDRVAVAFQPSCGHCRPCRLGESAACGQVPPTSMFGVGKVSGDWGGAFADLIRVPFAASMLVPLPPGAMLAAYASAADNLMDAQRCIAPYVNSGEPFSVLIFGDYDSIPLYAVLWARALGAEHVTYCTASNEAAANADRLGARVETVTAWPDRLAAHDLTVCAVQDPAVLNAALRSTRAGGHCTSTTIFAGDVTLPMRELYMRGANFHTGRVNSAALLAQAVSAIADGLLDPLAVDTQVVGFDELIPALLERRQAKLVATR